METDANKKLKLTRGRPSTSSKQKKSDSLQYAGPSLDDILRMSNEQIITAIETLGYTPCEFEWFDDDSCRSIDAWLCSPPALSYRIKSFIPSNIDLLEWTEQTPPKFEEQTVTKIKEAAWQIHSHGLRVALCAQSLKAWIESLSNTELVEQINLLRQKDKQADQVSVSEKRYTSVTLFREELLRRMWWKLVKASKLCDPETDMRVPRPNDGWIVKVSENVQPEGGLMTQ